ncbi:MAG: hypothetical protein WCB96_04360 [Candidatus Aminicenantales bacterium]
MTCSAIILSIVTVISYVALAIITFFYMKETRRIREIAVEDLKIGASPQVFVSNIGTFQTLDEEKKKIAIQAIIQITNTGRTEATNVIIKYKLLIAEHIQIPWESQEAPYIFPNQSLLFNSLSYAIDLNEEDTKSAKSQLENNKKISFRPETKPKYEMEIKIEYFGYQKEKKILSWLCDYRWDGINWGMRILKEDKTS